VLDDRLGADCADGPPGCDFDDELVALLLDVDLVNLCAAIGRPKAVLSRGDRRRRVR
jgi:hypothetical protein